MWVAALIPPTMWMKLAPVVYSVGVVLLLGVEFFGETSKGATRWLDLGVARIQPSEMLKISVPLMLAWYFHKHEALLKMRHFAIAAAIVCSVVGQ